jgi:uncharacterized protein YciI
VVFLMNFDSFTVALLILRSDAPKLSEERENALQDAHMAHLAKLHDEGHLLAAGPILGSPDRELRGLSIFRGSLDEVKLIADRDPGVLEGRYKHEFFPWIVPKDAVSFSHTRFPRSMSEVSTDNRPS